MFPSPYFDDQMARRQRLLWAIGTRRQLERWEPLVAEAVRLDFTGGQIDPGSIWQADVEQHLTLVAARNLIRALDLPPATNVRLDETVRAEIVGGRDLLEHWVENMAIFNTRPRPKAPSHPSGKGFAERNPNSGPYDGLSWSSTVGARLTPQLGAPTLHGVLDEVEADVLANAPDLRRFIPERASSPWIFVDEPPQSGWWPAPAES